MGLTVRFRVNGTEAVVPTDPERRLLDVLREDLRLTGTKYGCGEGQCGACLVHLDGEPTRSGSESTGRKQSSPLTPNDDCSTCSARICG